MNTELFEIGESLSPEAVYLRDFPMKTYREADQSGADGNEWVAYENERDLGAAEYETGATKLEAVSKMNQRAGKLTFDEWRLRKAK
jgi:hypothetical protein